MLAPPDAGYGVVGMIPGAAFAISYPFSAPDLYNVPDAINRAAAEMLPGDVLLIEQQGWNGDTYTPVEIDPAVFDAIATAVAQGIVVIEPAGNGACNLDDPIWEGWFDRNVRDSGAIMVGGGASPFGELTARSWYPFGSCYGDRVDVQGWFDAIVTASAEMERLSSSICSTPRPTHGRPTPPASAARARHHRWWPRQPRPSMASGLSAREHRSHRWTSEPPWSRRVIHSKRMRDTHTSVPSRICGVCSASTGCGEASAPPTDRQA